MKRTIAIAGKGGTGKTTIAALLINSLRKIGSPILAVDADPNSNLNVLLGLTFDQTIADIREQTKDLEPSSSISRTDLIGHRLQEIMVESEDIDLLVMGRPEGPGCYCAVNNLLRTFLSRISKNYRFVIIDNEAGMEHLSRRTTDDVDILFLVCENTVVSLNAAIRAREIAKKINLSIKEIYLIINKVEGELSEVFRRLLLESGIDIAGEVPMDLQVLSSGEKGESILGLGNSKALDAISKIVERHPIKRNDITKEFF